MANQLNDYVSKCNLRELYQSAYVEHHSTETALLRVKNDLAMHVDRNGGAVLVLLDLSAAFDTIDHEILLTRLADRFCIAGKALSWIASYLKDRKESVIIDECRSRQKALCYGVPQGSVLGPLLFSFYTSELGDVIGKHGVQYHLYADDTQLYLAFNPGCQASTDLAANTLSKCLDDIKAWMQDNFLQLNTDKTETILLSTRQGLRQCNLVLPFSDTSASEHVRNLGAILDCTFTMELHVNVTCKTALYHLRNISHVRRYLDKATTEKVVHAFVSSRLDYCNSLLYGISSTLVGRLQRVQNMAARIITKTKKYDHITPILQTLHWLPIKKRIEYKIYLIIFKCLHNMSPQYLSNLLVPYQPSWELRSSSKGLLQVKKCRLRTFGDQAFSNYAPKLWNALPEELKSIGSLEQFKSRLKTYLFNQYYGLS